MAAERSSYPSTGELTPNSSFTSLVDVWLADLDLEGKVAESTRARFERNMRQPVMPVFEGYALREITVSEVDQFLKRLAANKSYSMAEQARTVLSLAFGLAVRYDAIQKNPVRETSRLLKPPSQAMASRAAAAVRYPPPYLRWCARFDIAARASRRIAAFSSTRERSFGIWRLLVPIRRLLPALLSC